MNKLSRTALLLFSAVIFCSCGSSSAKNKKEETLTAADVIARIEQSGEFSELDYSLEFSDEEMISSCEKLYGVPYTDVSDCGILFVESGEQADEVSVLDCENAQTYLEARREARIKDFEGYAPAESDKCKNARIIQQGGLWLLIISDKADKIEQLISNP